MKIKIVILLNKSSSGSKVQKLNVNYPITLY